MIKKPNVLVAGFPRSGSTYIYQVLKQHPEIFIPEIKEINYFNKDHFFMSAPEILNPRYFKSKRWYYNFFKTNKKIVMDFSILSALDVASAKRIHDELEDIKIIFVTRNKKDFLKSVKSMMYNWKMFYKNYEEYADFDYYINNYKRFFSKIYILPIERFNKNPQKELDKLCNFLEAEKYNFNLSVDKHETKKHWKIGVSALLKRKIYFKIIRAFYRLISFTVTSKAMPAKSN